MEIAATMVNAAVIAVVGALLWWATRGRFEALEAKLEVRFTGLEGRIDRLEGRMDRLEERMDRGFDSVRSDITRIALALGVRPEAEAGGG